MDIKWQPKRWGGGTWVTESRACAQSRRGRVTAGCVYMLWEVGLYRIPQRGWGRLFLVWSYSIHYSKRHLVRLSTWHQFALQRQQTKLKAQQQTLWLSANLATDGVKSTYLCNGLDCVLKGVVFFFFFFCCDPPVDHKSPSMEALQKICLHVGGLTVLHLPLDPVDKSASNCPRPAE